MRIRLKKEQFMKVKGGIMQNRHVYMVMLGGKLGMTFIGSCNKDLYEEIVSDASKPEDEQENSIAILHDVVQLIAVPGKNQGEIDSGMIILGNLILDGTDRIIELTKECRYYAGYIQAISGLSLATQMPVKTPKLVP